MDKSEELCKLLCVTTRYKVVIEGMKKPRSSWVMTGECFDTKEDAQSFIDSIITKYKKASICEFKVDLTKPSNFIKLLDIILKSVEEPHNFTILIGLNILDAIDDKITQYIDFLSRETETKYKLIKQAQQIEWEY